LDASDPQGDSYILFPSHNIRSGHARETSLDLTVGSFNRQKLEGSDKCRDKDLVLEKGCVKGVICVEEM